MAKCPICGKIWFCSGEGAEYYYFTEKDDVEHCRICRCDECRLEAKQKEIRIYNYCFHFAHDPYRCEKFKIARFNLGHRCQNCPHFIYINWDEIPIAKEFPVLKQQKLCEKLEKHLAS